MKQLENNISYDSVFETRKSIRETVTKKEEVNESKRFPGKILGMFRKTKIHPFEQKEDKNHIEDQTLTDSNLIINISLDMNNLMIEFQDFSYQNPLVVNLQAIHVAFTSIEKKTDLSIKLSSFELKENKQGNNPIIFGNGPPDYLTLEIKKDVNENLENMISFSYPLQICLEKDQIATLINLALPFINEIKLKKIFIFNEIVNNFNCQRV